jgi:hypothetical protein
VRKQLLLEEVNAIGTAYLRADFLPDPQRDETRKLLRKYVDIRTETAKHPEKMLQALVDSEALHDQLWSQVANLSKHTAAPVFLALYTQSLNDVIDFHSKRVTVGMQYRIPVSVWIALYFVTILTMATVGYSFKDVNPKPILVSLMLTLAFSSIILLVADLDRPMGGLLKLNQQPMIELQQKLNLSAK